MKQGQEFSIIIKFSKESGFFEIPIEYPVEGYSAKAESKEGISWISEDGENWEDLYSFKANPCIKAFTYNEELDGTLAEGVSKTDRRLFSGRTRRNGIKKSKDDRRWKSSGR